MSQISFSCLHVAVTSTILLFIFSSALAYPFGDVSIQAGLDYSEGRRKKYGGPCVADLNADGFPDLLLAHHDDKYAEAYLGGPNGKFTKLQWYHWDDTHAFVPFRANAYYKSMHFILMRGGSYGIKPTAPLIFTITGKGKVQKTSSPQFAKGRGRTAVVMPLNPNSPAVNNVLLINVSPVINNNPHNFAAVIRSDATLGQTSLFGFEKEGNSFASVLDVDGDGKMELATFENLRIYKNTSPLKLTDITSSIVPSNLHPIRGVTAVAELDFDNDGKMDLYIARSVTYDLKWLKQKLNNAPSDYLLRNVGGRYVDATKTARIPGGGESRGVTVGDFNNDGWIDILVTQHTQPHRLLWNNGDGTFRFGFPNFGRLPGVHGDAPVAVDYNLDGKLDVILSEGDYFDRTHGGQFRIMKNFGNHPNYLLVRVGSSPWRIAVSLHAVATVRSGGRSMIRRVGSPGITISVSYIELLHFGLGYSTTADVTVRWSDGSTLTKRNVKANSIVTFGFV